MVLVTIFLGGTPILLKIAHGLGKWVHLDNTVGLSPDSILLGLVREGLGQVIFGATVTYWTWEIHNSESS